jgi:hypothetical protein
VTSQSFFACARPLKQGNDYCEKHNHQDAPLESEETLWASLVGEATNPLQRLLGASAVSHILMGQAVEEEQKRKNQSAVSRSAKRQKVSPASPQSFAAAGWTSADTARLLIHCKGWDFPLEPRFVKMAHTAVCQRCCNMEGLQHGKIYFTGRKTDQARFAKYCHPCMKGLLT